LRAEAVPRAKLPVRAPLVGLAADLPFLL
jgi:hypothetical protein